jgi:hypothetical protein
MMEGASAYVQSLPHAREQWKMLQGAHTAASRLCSIKLAGHSCCLRELTESLPRVCCITA